MNNVLIIFVKIKVKANIGVKSARLLALRAPAL